MDSEIYVDISNGMLHVIPSGKLLEIFSISAFTFFATSMAFSPGSMNMLSTAAEPPLMPLSVA